MADEQMKVNVMVCGKAGVGKTVLINHLLGSEAGQTGIGKPVTQEITSYSVSGSPLVCYDTPGFEIKQSSTQELIGSFDAKVSELQATMDGDLMIDVLLYCVCYQGVHRFEETEAAFISHMQNEKHIPVIVVFTQHTGNPAKWSENKWHNTVVKTIRDKGCLIKDSLFIPVLCYDMEVETGDDTVLVPMHGIDTLISHVFDEALTNRSNKIANSKMASLDAACKQASKWVVFYSGIAAAGVAIIAVPGADVAALVANETFMANHIYDIIYKDSNIGQYDKSEVVSIIADLTVPLVGSIVGPVVFNEAIKVAGIVAAPFTGGLSEGAAIAVGAVVGFGVTFALGKTTISLLKRLATGDITLEQIKEKDPAVMAKAKESMRSQYEIGKQYAKEHPDQIRTKK